MGECEPPATSDTILKAGWCASGKLVPCRNFAVYKVYQVQPPRSSQNMNCPAKWVHLVPATKRKAFLSYRRTSVKDFAIKAWRLPAALESASSFLVYELWVCALRPVYQGSSGSHT